MELAQDTTFLALAAGAVVIVILGLFFVRTLLRLLVLVAAVVVAVAVAAELVIPPVVEDRIEDQVRARLPNVGSVSAELGPPPVVARLAAFSEVGHLALELTDLRRGALTVTEARVRLEGVEVDRGALWQQEVRLRDVDVGEISVVLTEADLAAVIGVPVRLEPGRAAVTVRGMEIAVDVALTDGALRLGDVFSVPIPLEDLLPCPLDGVVEAGRVRLTCRVEEVPPALVDAFQQAVGS